MTRTSPTHPQAAAAVHAARHAAQWGGFAALRYCQRRATPDRLFYLAQALEAFHATAHRSI